MADLLTLPTEIRLMILENLLLSTFVSTETGDPEVWPYAKSDDLATRDKLQILFPQILRTCKRLYCEGIPLLYSKNRFCIHAPTTADANTTNFDGLGHTQRFLRGIGTSNAGLIRRLTIGGGGMLQTGQLQEVFVLANGLNELVVVSLGPRCKAPYIYMLQYYLNVEAALKGSSTSLTGTSSAIPNGFVPEGLGIIHLRFHREGSLSTDELEIHLGSTISYFREKVREQEREWRKQGWNLPIMVEPANGVLAFV
ncbi:hypothetical protein TWF569_006622 [Orbilia oligospora]|uniref:F-box domain-containing protein n=1 Tax=Orbilia oligospora TaxID=2813651 RepID=A0A7C8ND52_ORBOL|nr:hypothetical protein TWF103_003265 [Orbilia oligospora]KAF3087418.1 hypothetical protein TWF102_010489 [Orbilia oligospora]KAF3102242.1 hypothetical protein TWF706_005387 [Orbilia oligospora]KAF3120237.1 hypothetical protein TWF703_002695 [Orbilia oligospora]KAF3124027.1 hypothetical protein TWF594_002139 [Orbilia oligospora]